MKTCRDYLREIKMRHGITTDYQLAKLLRVTPQAVCLLQSGDSTFNDSTAMRVAELLPEYSADQIVAHAHRERARTPAERRLWESIAGKVVAIVGAVGLAIATYPADLAAAVRAAACVLCKIPRGRRLVVLAAASLPSAAAIFCPSRA